MSGLLRLPRIFKTHRYCLYIPTWRWFLLFLAWRCMQSVWSLTNFHNWMEVEKTETQEEKSNTASFHKQLKEWSLVYRSVSLKISSYLSYLKVTSLLQIFLAFNLNLWGFFLAGTLWKYVPPPVGSHFSLFMQLEGTPAYLRLLLIYLFEVNQHIQYLLDCIINVYALPNYLWEWCK